MCKKLQASVVEVGVEKEMLKRNDVEEMILGAVLMFSVSLELIVGQNRASESAGVQCR